MRISAFGLLLAVLMLGSCNPSPTVAPGTPDEQMKAQEEDSVSHRNQVRQAAISHVKKYYPEWTIQGVAFYSNAGTDYVVGIDVTSGDQRQTIQLNVELFTKDSGEKYWKTSFAPPPVGAKPIEFALEPYTSP